MKGIKIEIENEKPMYLYRPWDVKSAIAHALYYTANPDSEMCIPNCAYERAEKMFEEWVNETREKKAVETLTEKHLCDTCACSYCEDRDIVKPITRCRGYSKKEE